MACNFDSFRIVDNSRIYRINKKQKGKEKGGNGITFNWKLLNNYPSKKPYFLSGGIGLDAVEDIKEFLKSDASKYCYALDVNSMFEDKPGFKNIEDLKLFIQDLKI